MWAKRGIQPKVKSAPTKEKVAFYGFVNPNTGELFTCKSEKFNFETFIEATRKFVKKHYSGKRLAIVLDNASWHKKGVKLIKDDEELQEMCEFIFLPPYSPDLNPIERVWRITRKNRTHNKYFSSLHLLTNTLTDFFSSLRKPNILLQNLCTII